MESQNKCHRHGNRPTAILNFHDSQLSLCVCCVPPFIIITAGDQFKKNQKQFEDRF